MSLMNATRMIFSMRAARQLQSNMNVTRAFFASSTNVLMAFDRSKLKYTDKHEWINEADGTIGITDYAQVRNNHFLKPKLKHLKTNISKRLSKIARSKCFK